MSEPIITSAASFRARAMALVIDSALLSATHIFLFLLVAARLFHQEARLDLEGFFALSLSYAAAFIFCFIFLHMVYFTLFHAWFGQTVGKMLMGLKVVTQDNRQLSPAVAFLRWTGYLLSFLPLASGFLWSAVDKDHCTWHDRLAQTRVISAEMT